MVDVMRGGQRSRQPVCANRTIVCSPLVLISKDTSVPIHSAGRIEIYTAGQQQEVGRIAVPPNPHAIGYVDRSFVNMTVKVILTVK